ncbi:hypothetical protein SKAU_G00313090 [Synaphobranchus kaupii]|uniref:Uncharacterized protein n=1 Tax=Synaphobranchus kaupii TaxID=118154 RepID=A0A9Q1ES24_SYNKA|nr:hypothetical protein SKAU_G00313090 [Synaphobranchus kaupii]
MPGDSRKRVTDASLETLTAQVGRPERSRPVISTAKYGCTKSASFVSVHTVTLERQSLSWCPAAKLTSLGALAIDIVLRGHWTDRRLTSWPFPFQRCYQKAKRHKSHKGA